MEINIDIFAKPIHSIAIADVSNYNKFYLLSVTFRKMKKDRNRKEKLRLRGGESGGGSIIESLQNGSIGSNAKLTRVQARF